MKKLKFKKNVKKLFSTIIVVGLFISIGLFSIIKIYNKKQYEKTYEYKLITIGYEEKDAKILVETFKKKEIEYILNNEKNDYYLVLIKDKYFIYENFYDYLEYYNENKDKTSREIVEIINTNIDNDYYTDTTKTNIKDKEKMLVNKYYYLDENYEPENLVSIPSTYAWGDKGSQQITEDTYDAFLNLWNAANKEGFYLMVNSSYRSYEKQEKIYNNYKKAYGTEYADSIAARPGFSEHQTGYSIDMFEKGTGQKDFHNTDSYKWLVDNAHKYGFILRFPEDKENVTGYNFESWHYRYVGVEIATYIYENNITFDEYYAYFVK